MLRPRTVRAAIIILIQHNLAWYTQVEDEGEVIEFNTDECLLRLRYGRFTWQAEQLYGRAVCIHAPLPSYATEYSHIPQAAEVVSLIMDHGKLQPKSIIERLCSTNVKKGVRY